MFIRIQGEKKVSCVTLDKLKIGKKAIVRKVQGMGDLRIRLLDMGIIPNTLLKITRKAPLGDPIQISLRGYELTLRGEDAKMIQVEEVN